MPDAIICPQPGDLEWHRKEAAKIASEYGLDGEVLDAFDRYVEAGDTPCHAMECALYDWDI